MGDLIPLILGFVFFLLIVVTLAKGIRIIPQSEVMLIERFGNYLRTLEPGLNFTIPYVDSPREMAWQKDGEPGMFNRIDMREIVLDVPQQSCITKDNVGLHIDAVLYCQVVDPAKAAYEVANLPRAVGQLAQTTLRSLVGEMDLDDTLASREKINGRLKQVLDDATEKWGTKVTRVEISSIQPPVEVQAAMEKQMQAERERRASVLAAEGDKQSRIARSEGERQEKINQAEGEKAALIAHAEGDATAIQKRVEAEQVAIQKIAQAFDGDTHMAAQFMIAQRYIEAYQRFAQGEGDKVFLPFEASNAMASFGSLADLFKKSEG